MLTEAECRSAMLTTLRSVNDDVLEPKGWDEPASLWGVTRKQLTDAIGFELHPMMGGDDFMDAPPSEILDWLATGLESPSSPAPRLPELYAVLFVAEAWMIERTAAEEREIAPGEIELQSDKVECRIICAVDIDGVNYTHRYDRITGVREESAWRNGVALGPNGSAGDGYVMDSLARIVRALA